MGRYYTSDDVANYMARATIVPYLLARIGWPGDPWQLVTDNSDLLQVLLTHRSRLSEAAGSLTILDPTCGDGAFLRAAHRLLQTLGPVRARLCGVDLCPTAVRTCRESLPNATIHTGNALAFPWQRTFPDVMQRDGFDIILGNPPYLELREVAYRPSGFALESTGAVHALVIEQALRLLQPQGALSLLLPLSLVSTQRMKPVQDLLEAQRSVWYANFSWRPAKLFVDVNRALTLMIAAPGNRTYVTGYQQWRSRDRAGLMERIRYQEVPRQRNTFWVPKIGCDLERTLYERMLAISSEVGDFLSDQDLPASRIYYRCDGGLYWKVFTDFAPAFSVEGRHGASTRLTWANALHNDWVLPLIGALSSDLFWWWYVITSNCRHLNPSDLHSFPLPATVLEDRAIQRATRAYLNDIVKHSRMKSRQQRQTGRTVTQTFEIRRSRPLIERLDDLLAPHYDLTTDELRFVKQFDLSFRLSCSRPDASATASCSDPPA